MITSLLSILFLSFLSFLLTWKVASERYDPHLEVFLIYAGNYRHGASHGQRTEAAGKPRSEGTQDCARFSLGSRRGNREVGLTFPRWEEVGGAGWGGIREGPREGVHCRMGPSQQGPCGNLQKLNCPLVD